MVVVAVVVVVVVVVVVILVVIVVVVVVVVVAEAAPAAPASSVVVSVALPVTTSDHVQPYPELQSAPSLAHSALRLQSCLQSPLASSALP